MSCSEIKKDTEDRLSHIKEMNSHEWNTDEAYLYWIENGVPDEASDDDLNFIASNIDIYNEVCEAYFKAKIIDF